MIKTFKKKIEILKLHDKCDIVETGYKLSSNKSYFCSCDSEKNEPLCEYCFNHCHRQHHNSNPAAIDLNKGKFICKCGLNNHQVIDISEHNDEKIIKTCLFSDWSDSAKHLIYFTYETKNLCLFCKNFCFSKNSNELEKKIANHKAVNCDCTNEIHSQPKLIFEKFLELPNIEKYDFENVTLTHMMNLIFKSEKSFNNNFNIFKSQTEKIYKEISTFRFDQYAGDSFYGISLGCFAKIVGKIKYFNYYSEGIKDYFKFDKVKRLLYKNFDSSTPSVWKVKKYLIENYRKIVFMGDFKSIPFITVKDVLNMNPFSRLLFLSNVSEDEKLSLKYYNSNYIKDIFKLISSFIGIKKISKEIFSILLELFTILKVFSKYNLLNNENIMKFCEINDSFFQTCYDLRKKLFKAGKLSLINEYLEVEQVINLKIAKSLMYLTIYFNDKMVYNYLEKVQNKMKNDKITFFNNETIISKTINKNMINICNFINNNYHKSRDINPCLVKSPVIKKLIEYTLESIYFNLENPDNYSIGLRSLLDKNKSIYLNYLSSNLTFEEKNFLNFLKFCSFDLDHKFLDYFEFKIQYSELKNFVFSMIKGFFRSIDTFEGNEILGTEKDSLNDINEEDFNKDKDIVVKEKGRKKKGVVFFLSKKGKSITTTDLMTVQDKKFKEIVKLSKFRVLMNKTFFIYDLVKFLKIQGSIYKYRKTDELKSEVIAIFDEIYKILIFYAEDNIDNCMTLLSSEIIYIFEILPDECLQKYIDIYSYCVRIINQDNFTKITNLNVIYKIFISIIYKSSFLSYELFYKSLKLISSIVLNEKNKGILKMSKIRKTFLKMINLSPIFQQILKLYFNKSNPNIDFEIDEQKPDELFSESSRNVNIENLKSEISEENELLPLNDKVPDDNINNHNTDSKLEILKKIFFRFLQIFNQCFETENCIEDIKEIRNIFHQRDIYFALKNNLNMVLRTEILKLFFTLYIKPFVNLNKDRDYNSIFSKKCDIENFSLLFDNFGYLKIKEELYKINVSFSYIKNFYPIIRHELTIFDKIIQNKFSDPKLLDYLEEGILIPFYVYIDIFVSFIYKENGHYNLKLYEITTLFLKLKKFIYDNKSTILNFKKKERLNLFRPTLHINSSIGNILLTINYTEEDYKILLEDIETLSSQKFEILNFKHVYTILIRNQTFMTKFQGSTLGEFFEKKRVMYDKPDIDDIRNKLKLAGFLNSPYEDILLDVITNYENGKQSFENGSFIRSLHDINESYSRKMSFMVVRYIFYLMGQTESTTRSIKLNICLLRLLQYNTENIQNEIILLFRNYEIDFEEHYKIFIGNFVGIVFNSSNPSIPTNNEYYFKSSYIIKMFKYLCEEHNIEFQNLFFLSHQIQTLDVPGQLEFEQNKERRKIFNFLTILIEKLIILSKWNKIDFSSTDESLNYYYEIFKVLCEFLIEMIQGTTHKNLETLLDKHHEESIIPFHNLLLVLKPILSNNNNKSEILYKIKKDLTELLCAFIEEKHTPQRLIVLLKNILHPEFIFEIIIPTLKKLYLRRHDESKIKEYNSIVFDKKFYIKLSKAHSSDITFQESIEFKLCNRLFQYIKILEINSGEMDTEFTLNLLKSYENSINFNENAMSNTVKLTKTQLENIFAIKFFNDITRVIEVQKDKEKVKVLFTLNPLAKYLTKNSKRQFLENVPRDSRFSKVFALMEATDSFHSEIMHFSKAINNKYLMYLLKINFYSTEMVLFFFTLLMNIFVFVSVYIPSSHGETKTTATTKLSVKAATNSTEAANANLHGSSVLVLNPWNNVIWAFASFFFFLNLVFAIIWLVVKFPLYYKIEKANYLRNKVLRKRDKIKIALLDVMIMKKEFLIFIWNTAFIIGAITNPSNYFIFSIQFFIIINLSTTLKNIVLSMTLRYKQFLTSLLFVCISVNVFSNISFFFMQGFYTNREDSRVCSTLFNCFFYHLNYGLRTDGGIGEHFKEFNLMEAEHKNQYIGSFLFIILYFILIIVILLAIVFGIVIDTFTELREHQQKIDHDKQNVCFICGASKDTLEKKGINYENHIRGVHHIWNYLYFMIYLKYIDKQDCNSINSFAIDAIQNKSISWFPAEEDTNDRED